MYTNKVLKYFSEPKNYGQIKNPDGLGKVGNPICGDVMWLYFKLGKNKKGEEIIKDIKFETFGCVAAIATSNMIVDLAKGKTIKEALKISKEDIVKALGGLPPIKLHCSVLAVDALTEAIYDYLIHHKKPIPKELEKSHEQIEKEKKIIKQKYKSWITTENKLHKKAKNKPR